MNKQKKDIEEIFNSLNIKTNIVDIKSSDGFMAFSDDKYYSETGKSFSNIAQKHFKEYPQQHRFYIYKKLNNENNDNVIFILFNPSYATPDVNDPTINNCIDLSLKEKRFSSLEVINLYSERNPNVKELEKTNNSSNIKFVTKLLKKRTDSVIVLAWGKKKIPQEWQEIITTLSLNEKIEIITKNGIQTQIRHPGNQGWCNLGGFKHAKLINIKNENIVLKKLILY